jgi:allophanate hydrolase subunit 2
VGGAYTVETPVCRIAVAGGGLSGLGQWPARRRLCQPYVRQGDRLLIGRANAGVRGYLAVAAGFDCPRSWAAARPTCARPWGGSTAHRDGGGSHPLAIPALRGA